MKLIKYIGIIILSLSVLGGRAQSLPPWYVATTGSNHTVFIKTTTNPLIDNAALDPGDAIGIFYDSAGSLACAGYTIWNNTNTFITAYGADGINEGLKSNELFKFKLWKKQSNCVVNIVAVSYAPGAPDTDRYVENGISELNTLSGTSILKEGLFSTQVTQATCIAGGRIYIKSTGPIPFSDLQFTAQDILTNAEFSAATNEIVELPVAEYRLIIQTDGCTTVWPELILITKDSNCNFPVISPNKDGIAEEYYIPYQGTTKIYDRYGVLRAEFSTPSTWNATDNAGQVLPMGTYIIVCDGYKEIIITVVR